MSAVVALWASGCSTPNIVQHPLAAPAVVTPSPAPALVPLPLPPPQADPLRDLVDRSLALFEKGQAELRLGHLDRAKSLFDQSLDCLLESPEGARSDAGVREHFDRLVVRISAYELRALAEGDGFAERPTVPASLDELLAIETFGLPAPPAALREAVESDLRSTAHDIPIPLNPRVLAYVDLFQGRLRDWFQAALQRSEPHLSMIQGALRSEGLPLDLAYIPIVESAFKPEAVSRARAKGVWQLMRGTAVEQGLKYDWYIDERSNPEKSTQAAVKYLKRLNAMFNGDWHLTLASYNSGPGTVWRAMRRRKTTGFWPLAEKRRVLPRETREYVPMVLAAMVIGRNPTQYGFTVTPAAPPAVDTVGVSRPVDLRRVAEWAGASVDDVQRLNPELRRWTTPVRGASFALKVPAGTGALVEQRMAALQPEDLSALQWYTVRRGDTLQTVANKLKVRRSDLAEANYLGARSMISQGQRLVIPRAPATLLASREERSEPVAAVVPAVRGQVSPAAASAGPSAGEPLAVTYQVKRGDTLSSIARQFRTTVELLRAWNGLRSDFLTPGDRLTVYAGRTSAQ
jgi:membrane-bound lytic murein transglycosylase D